MAVPQSAFSPDKVKTQNSVLRGEYVKLYHLLDQDIDMANEYEPTMTNDTEGQVSFKLSDINIFLTAKVNGAFVLIGKM